VVKCFHQAKNYIAVDDERIAQTMRWLITQQAENGSFAEPPNGRVIHVDMQARIFVSIQIHRLSQYHFKKSTM